MKKLAAVLALCALGAACGDSSKPKGGVALGNPADPTTTSTALGAGTETAVTADEAGGELSSVPSTGPTATAMTGMKPRSKAPASSTTTTSGRSDDDEPVPDEFRTGPDDPAPAGPTTTTRPPVTTTTRPPTTTTTTVTYTGPHFRCNPISPAGWECRGTTLRGEGYWACWPDSGWQCMGETGAGLGRWAWHRISATEWSGGGDTATGPRLWSCKWDRYYWTCEQRDENWQKADPGYTHFWAWMPGAFSGTYKSETSGLDDKAVRVVCWDDKGWLCSGPKALSTHMQMPVPFPLVTFGP